MDAADLEAKRRQVAEGIAQREALNSTDPGIVRQRREGRSTLRERIGMVLDDDSWNEMGPLAGSFDEDDTFVPANYLLGTGSIDGRTVVCGGEDFTVSGGSPTVAGLRKSVYAEDYAYRLRMPLVRFHEGGGGSVSAKGRRMQNPHPHPRPRLASLGRALQEVPVVSIATGPVAGLPAARFAAAHFRIMVRGSQVMIAGPAIVERAFGQRPTKEELGGVGVHKSNGLVDAIAEDEAEAMQIVRRFLSYLPSNRHSRPAHKNTNDTPDRSEGYLDEMVPEERAQPYDMRRVLSAIVDQGSFFELGATYGGGIITGLARLNGEVVGVLGNDCTCDAGAMGALGAQKMCRWLDICEQFHIPIVSFVDEPGFAIGLEAERSATILAGTEAVMRSTMCDLPWASILVRRSFGVGQGAHYGHNSTTVAWPTAEVGPLPIEGGVAVAFKRQIEAAADPQAERKRLENELAARFSPMNVAQDFGWDDLIAPSATRPWLCRWLALQQNALDLRVTLDGKRLPLE